MRILETGPSAITDDSNRIETPLDSIFNLLRHCKAIYIKAGPATANATLVGHIRVSNIK